MVAFLNINYPRQYFTTEDTEITEDKAGEIKLNECDSLIIELYFSVPTVHSVVNPPCPIS
jgi:hypothetical protein